MLHIKLINLKKIFSFLAGYFNTYQTVVFSYCISEKYYVILSLKICYSGYTPLSKLTIYHGTTFVLTDRLLSVFP